MATSNTFKGDNKDSDESRQPRERRKGLPDGLRKKKQGIRRQKYKFTPEEVNQLSQTPLTMSDFLNALKEVKPSTKLEGVTFVVPNITWDDIGGLKAIREKLTRMIVEPIINPEMSQALDLSEPMRILLVGPSGCGKRLSARAAAKAAGIDFLHVDGTANINVMALFTLASDVAPCVIFLDDIDALCPRSSGHGKESSHVSELLLAMDKVEPGKKVFIIAATSNLGCLDPKLSSAYMKETIYVNLPSPEERLEILKVLTKDSALSQDDAEFKMADDVNLNSIAKECHGYSGADLKKVIDEAKLVCVRKSEKE